MPSISLVVPAYNEEAGLEATVRRCLAVLRQCTDDYELIVLDDCSTDGTATAMERVARIDPERIRTMQHARNRGIAATFEDLYRAATKDWVFLIPADGEYPPEALLDALPLLATSDVVVCRRVRKDYTPYRHLVSGAYRWLTRLLFGVELWDPGSTKVVKRAIITETPVRSTSVYVEAERLIRAARRGSRIAKVDIVPERRYGGRARGARLRTVVESARDMARLRLELWLRR